MRNRSRWLIAAAGSLALLGGAVAGVVALEPRPSPTRDALASPSPLERAATTPSPAPTPTPPPAPPPPPEAPAAAPQPPPPAPAPAPDAAEGEVLALTNAERAANGCAPLSADEGLAAVARAHSADMAARDYVAHVSPEGLDPFDRAAAAGQTASAENIAAGQPDAASVVASWMASPGHRANILNCSLTRLGTGVGYGGSYGITWTQLFG